VEQQTVAPAAQGAQQQQLIDEFTARLEQIGDADALVRFMGEILRLLLRREGDAEFLAAVQDGFVAGMAGRNWDAQRRLARDVIGTVIQIRPEIAIAWRRDHSPSSGVPERRASDRQQAAAAAAAAVSDQVAAAGGAEQRTALFVATALGRRLGVFRVAAPPFPSMAYCHGQPFFLFTQSFTNVVAVFVTEILMDLCRDNLERHVYRGLNELLRSGADEKRIEGYLASKRTDIWKILTGHLGHLASLHSKAEAKLTAAQTSPENAQPQWKEVLMPVSRKRVIRVLGVRFTFGQQVTTRKVRVRADAGQVMEPVEMEALQLLTRFHDIAAEEGLELPQACDFRFLRMLFQFDAPRFAQAAKELSALARHPETSRTYLFVRLKAVDEVFPNTLADALVLMMFDELADGGFGFQELYDVCVGSGRNASALASKRPFVHAEVGRRPRDLVFQIREVLRRRDGADKLEKAVRLLLEVWGIMAKNRFGDELDAAIGIVSAFPVAFSSDPDEAVFAQIGRILGETLTAAERDADKCVAAVRACYARVKVAKK
jgi:hypothetical protein